MHKGSILVVDDESEIREGLELLLTSEGYGVTSAGTGESGLAKLEERPFDLLLALVERSGLQHGWQSRSESANSDCTGYPPSMPTPVRIYSDYV